MKHETKSLTIEKMESNGQGLARIAVLSAIDHDGDTYLPGAFSWKEGAEQWASILPAHQRSAMPLGKARIYEDGDAAFAELHLNLDTPAGKDWHSTLKFDLANGRAVQEWSYGFGVLDSQIEERSGDRVRVLKRLDVHEVSPVLRGAGVGTATLSMKGRGSFSDQLDALLEEIDDVIARAGSVKALREAEGRDMSKARLEQLAGLKARLDALLAGGDPTGTDEADAKAEEKARAELEAIMIARLTNAARRRVEGGAQDG